MVRIPVFKRLYNLSDAQMEYQLLDRMNDQRFCALQSATNIPARTTIWTFENRIGEVGARAVFDGVHAQLLRAGYLARGGQIIDATLVPAPRQHLSGEKRAMVEEGAMPATWRPAKRRQKDTDASWTKQHGKSHFGYKLSISVDRRYKVIRCIQIGREPIQRKGTRNRALSKCQQGRNRCIAKTRARVEHAFAAITQLGGKFIRTIGQARANFAMTMMAACHNIKRMVYLRRIGIEAF